MRILVETTEGDKFEGILALKDESFLMVKITKGMVRVMQWCHIKSVKRKGDQKCINLDVFRKVRE